MPSSPDGKRSDIEVARRLEFSANSIVVFDRGYTDYLWLTVRTRVEELYQQPVRFRRIEFTDDQGNDYVFLTNRLDLAAATIAAINRQRWQIESFSEPSNRTCGSRPSSAHPRTLCTSRSGRR